MAVSPKNRARVLLQRAANRSYSEIANNIDGVSEHQVGRIVREVEDVADASSAEEAVVEELLTGMMQTAATGAADDLALAFSQ